MHLPEPRGWQIEEIFLFAARMTLIRLSKLCPPSSCYAHPEQKRQINEFNFYFPPPLQPPPLCHRHKQSGIDTNSTELQTFCVCPKRINALPDAGLAHTQPHTHTVAHTLKAYLHWNFVATSKQTSQGTTDCWAWRRGGVKQSTCTGREKRERGGRGGYKTLQLP